MVFDKNRCPNDTLFSKVKFWAQVFWENEEKCNCLCLYFAMYWWELEHRNSVSDYNIGYESCPGWRWIWAGVSGKNRGEHNKWFTDIIQGCLVQSYDWLWSKSEEYAVKLTINKPYQNTTKCKECA